MKLYIFGFLDFAIFRFLDVLMIGSLVYNVGLAFGTNRVGGSSVQNPCRRLHTSKNGVGGVVRLRSVPKAAYFEERCQLLFRFMGRPSISPFTRL